MKKNQRKVKKIKNKIKNRKKLMNKKKLMKKIN